MGSNPGLRSEGRQLTSWAVALPLTEDSDSVLIPNWSTGYLVLRRIYLRKRHPTWKLQIFRRFCVRRGSFASERRCVNDT